MDETPEGTKDPIEYMRQERPRPNIADVMERQERARFTNRRMGAARELNWLWRSFGWLACGLIVLGGLALAASVLVPHDTTGGSLALLLLGTGFCGGGAWGWFFAFVLHKRWSDVSALITDDDLTGAGRHDHTP